MLHMWLTSLKLSSTNFWSEICALIKLGLLPCYQKGFPKIGEYVCLFKKILESWRNRCHIARLYARIKDKCKDCYLMWQKLLIYQCSFEILSSKWILLCSDFIVLFIFQRSSWTDVHPNFEQLILLLI